MINIKDYIESGILNDYCLGLLSEEKQREVELNCLQYPELQAEVDAIHESLDQFSLLQGRQAPAELNNRIWSILEQLSREESMELNNLPLLTKYSNRDHWLRVVKSLLPPTLDRPLFALILKDDEEATQTLLWSKVDIPDEVHDNLHESFMILEGECECFVDGVGVRLGAGGYLDIPLHAHHDVKLISPQAMAIVQRRKIV